MLRDDVEFITRTLWRCLLRMGHMEWRFIEVLMLGDACQLNVSLPMEFFTCRVIRHVDKSDIVFEAINCDRRSGEEQRLFNVVIFL